VVEVQDAAGKPVPARISVTGSDGRSYAPDHAWIHADDGFDRKLAKFETQYFHGEGTAKLKIPTGKTRVTVWHGLEHRIASREVNVGDGAPETVTIRLEPLDLPGEWKEWRSADLHVHMNYGGAYRATPATLALQMRAEDLDVVHNLIVNKEQRIPDVGYFTPRPDPASTPDALLLHAQEFHTSFWGHVGLLGLDDHLLIPDYSGYPNTAAASLYPTNAVIADLARSQHALTGYVHPFDWLPDPAGIDPLTNALPVDAALGKVDYYEVVGFSDHRASAEVWHRLLNCGIRLTAGAGTDAMTNFASLRGPVGVNRVYTRMDGGINPALQESSVGLDSSGQAHARGVVGPDLSGQAQAWFRAFRAGRTVATNGPLLGFTVEGKGPGAEFVAEGGTLAYKGWLRSLVPVQHLEILQNGKVVRRVKLRKGRTEADFEGTLPAERGWVLLRAWNEQSAPEVFDLYAYATTNPVFIDRSGPGPACDTAYFLAWIDRIGQAAAAHPDYHTDDERRQVLQDIARARAWFEGRQ
jgi:hypothetical protein